MSQEIDLATKADDTKCCAPFAPATNPEKVSYPTFSVYREELAKRLTDEFNIGDEVQAKLKVIGMTVSEGKSSSHNIEFEVLSLVKGGKPKKTEPFKSRSRGPKLGAMNGEEEDED